MTGLNTRPQIPPFPMYFVLTDRADGTKWVLRWSTNGANPPADGLGWVSISNQLPTDFEGGFVVYGPRDGPRLANKPEMQLLVRGGYLGYEMATLPNPTTDMDQPRILARNGLIFSFRKIILGTAWAKDGDTIAFTENVFGEPGCGGVGKAPCTEQK